MFGNDKATFRCPYLLKYRVVAQSGPMHADNVVHTVGNGACAQALSRAPLPGWNPLGLTQSPQPAAGVLSMAFCAIKFQGCCRKAVHPCVAESHHIQIEYEITDIDPGQCASTGRRANNRNSRFFTQRQIGECLGSLVAVRLRRFRCIDFGQPHDQRAPIRLYRQRIAIADSDDRGRELLVCAGFSLSYTAKREHQTQIHGCCVYQPTHKIKHSGKTPFPVLIWVGDFP